MESPRHCTWSDSSFCQRRQQGYNTGSLELSCSCLMGEAVLGFLLEAGNNTHFPLSHWGRRWHPYAEQEGQARTGKHMVPGTGRRAGDQRDVHRGRSSLETAGLGFSERRAHGGSERRDSSPQYNRQRLHLNEP